MPFVGTALSSLAGAAGLNRADAQVQLASQQDAATAAQSAVGLSGRTAMIRGRGLSGGTFSAARESINAARVNAKAQAGQQSRAAMEAWDLANPEPTKGFLEGLNSDLNPLYKGTPIFDAANAARSQNRNQFRTLISSESQAAIAVIDDEERKLDREQKYQIASSKNELQMATMENRFRPMAAKGAFAVGQFSADRGRLGPNANSQDYEYLAIQGNISKEELRSAQRDLANNLIFGKAIQYNPYTTSPLSQMERATETTTGGFNALQESIDKLTAAINALPKGGGPK